MNYKQLKLNVDKTKYVLIGKKQDLKNLREVEFRIDDTPITLVDNVRDLGVLLDGSLSLSLQINNVVRISGHHLRNIAFIRKYLDEESLKKLIYNCVISRLDYCNSIYYNLPKTQLKKLQNIFNRAARLIRGVGRRDRITPVLIDLHWLPVKARIAFKICVLTFTALNTGKPGYLKQMLHIRQPTAGISTRLDTDGLKLVEPRCSTSIGFRAFRSAAPRLFNKLPYELRASDNLVTFKKKLKAYLFTQCYDLQDLTINEDYSVS